MVTIYQVWRTLPANNSETYVSTHFDQQTAMNEANRLINTHNIVNESRVVQRGHSVGLQTPNGKVLVMYAARSVDVKGQLPTQVKEVVKEVTVEKEVVKEVQVEVPAAVEELYEWERAKRMYNDYLDLRKNTLALIKKDESFAELVSDAPGPPPGRKKKAAADYIKKPQDLTPSRINCIYEYLHQKGVDI